MDLYSDEISQRLLLLKSASWGLAGDLSPIALGYTNSAADLSITWRCEKRGGGRSAIKELAFWDREHTKTNNPRLGDEAS